MVLKPKQTEELREIHMNMLVAFHKEYDNSKIVREQSREDRRFYSIPGAHWESEFGKQFENRPKLEVNKAHLSVLRIINEYRNNRITVDFVPMDEAGDGHMADTCDRLYRADEDRSGADEAYDNAFEEAVGGGFGAYRYRAEYEDEYDEENEYQRVSIEPIYDADSSVYFLNSYRQDKRDADGCVVLVPISIDKYKEKYKDDPVSWPKAVQGYSFNWVTPEVIFLAEFYKVEENLVTVRIFKTLDGKEERYSEEDFEYDKSLEEMLIGTGAQEISTKKIKRRKIHKYLANGNCIIEDCGQIPGKYIPIVPQYGKRWVVDGVEWFMGHVRLAKDISRVKDMLISRLAEISSLSTIEKPIVTEEMMAGHEDMWANDAVKNYPYQLVNTIEDLNGNEVLPQLQYTKVPNIPPALAALHQAVEQDIKDLLGNSEEGEKIQPRISGKAVELIQNRLDMQSFIYISNTAKARQRGGVIWLSMNKDLLVEKGRKIKTKGRDGSFGTVELLRPVKNKDTKAIEYENDFSKASMEVSVDVGPSFSSRKAATVTALTGVLGVTKDPETAQVLGATIMMNLEGEGLSGIREYYRKKLIRMGAEKPSQKEAEELREEMQNMRPDANTVYLEAAAKAEDARGAEARAKTVKIAEEAKRIEAETDETRAKTLEILSEIDANERNQAVNGLQLIRGDQSTT